VNRTEAALLSRGLDSANSERLRKDGWTLAKLKECDDRRLIDLGIPKFVIEKLRSGPRSEIPFTTLVQVLFANRFTCCVCRDEKKSIVVHHIRDWAESHDHSPDNLAVLCLDDHGKAHSVNKLSRNLDEPTISQFKKRWEAKIRRFDTAAIINSSRVNFDAWWYFNHVRLFELAKALNINLGALHHYGASLAAKLIDRQGFVRPRASRALYMYSGSEGMILYDYVREIMERVLSGLTVLNISDCLDRVVLMPLLKPADFVFVQGAHWFASSSGQERGRHQTYVGTRRANHVEVTFTFDRWEATSVSAWGWLRGRRDAASVLRVVNVGRLDGKLHLQCTVIGISAAAAGLKQREYASFPYRRWVTRTDETEEEAEDFVEGGLDEDPFG